MKRKVKYDPEAAAEVTRKTLRSIELQERKSSVPQDFGFLAKQGFYKAVVASDILRNASNYLAVYECSSYHLQFGIKDARAILIECHLDLLRILEYADNTANVGAREQVAG